MEVKFIPDKPFAEYVDRGDCLMIDEPRCIASNLKEFIGFMRFALESGIDVCFTDGNIDTRSVAGRFFMEMLWGIDRFDDEYFGGRG